MYCKTIRAHGGLECGTTHYKAKQKSYAQGKTKKFKKIHSSRIIIPKSFKK